MLQIVAKNKAYQVWYKLCYKLCYDTVATTNDNNKNDNSMPTTTKRVYTYVNNDTVCTRIKCNSIDIHIYICVCVWNYYTTRTKTNTIIYCSSFSLLLLFIIFILQFLRFCWHRQSTLFGLYFKYSACIFYN